MRQYHCEKCGKNVRPKTIYPKNHMGHIFVCPNCYQNAKIAARETNKVFQLPVLYPWQKILDDIEFESKIDGWGDR